MKNILKIALSSLLVLGGMAAGQDSPAKDQVEALKAKLAAQQRQIEQLSQAVTEQQKVLDGLTSKSVFKSLGEVASTTPMIPAANPAPPAASSTTPSTARPQGGSMGSTPAANPCEAMYDVSAPYLRIGDTCLTPVGFMDITMVGRDKFTGNSIGTSFGSVPFDTPTTVGANLSEWRLSPQNSRIGFRFDGKINDVRFIGYNEFDFLGTSGSTGITTSNGGFVPRLRLFWVDVRKGQWEFLGGQSWSMLTPNRKGISALPQDIFYSQSIDVNYVAGLTWTRQPGVRVLYHPSDTVTFGLALENPDQYIGGSAGGSGITLPTALAALATGNQLDASPNISSNNPANANEAVHPDVIAKVAFDPTSRFHFDMAGIFRSFRDYNPNTTGPGALTNFSTHGGGVQFGMNAEIFKGFRLITTNYYSDGGGRYIFGQAPDVIVRADGSLSPVHASGTVDGFEANVTKNLLLYGYYGGIYIGRNGAFDANGTTRIGYGYPGAPNSQNRVINEITFGFNQTIWKDAKYGAVNFMGQYQYLSRNPWAQTVGLPANAFDNTFYLNLRYTLPGSAPSIK
jgi:uncharacterized coiled-coil protein SlyX